MLDQVDTEGLSALTAILYSQEQLEHCDLVPLAAAGEPSRVGGSLEGGVGVAGVLVAGDASSPSTWTFPPERVLPWGSLVVSLGVQPLGPIKGRLA